MSLDPRPPLYARVLRLRRIRPSGLLCFLFFEGMIALGVLLALAELVSWWAVPMLPVVVAGMVKLNDLIAGGPAGAARPGREPRGSAESHGGAESLGGAGAPGSAALSGSGGPESAGEEPSLPDPGAGPHGQLSQVGPPPPDPEPEDPVAALGPRDARQVSRDPAATLDPADSPRQRFRQSAHRRYQ